MSSSSPSESEQPPEKRARTELPPPRKTLHELCRYPGRWQEATERALSHPEEAAEVDSTLASPLALACRYGAPLSCVQAILEAAPRQLHHMVPSRGTPIHEAVVCDSTGSDVIKVLLRADEELEASTGTRAALLQDVDGHTPLHLMVRRRFQYRLVGDRSVMDRWKTMLEALVESCPAAVGIPDRGEYEEPPLVMALKASLYVVGTDGSDELFNKVVEGRIHEMVQCMLHHYPQAASQVLTGARGRYTALHSAVFHGRCSDTINLLLQAEQISSRHPGGAALLANTQGELPLHFATMRGEPPRSITLLANAAPKAVQTRDAWGLTPMHWLWTRFISTLLGLNNERGETTIESERGEISPTDSYSDFCTIETGHFYPDFGLIRKLDPPVDFLRMRHIPPELLGDSPVATEWAERTVQVLRQVRGRYSPDIPSSQTMVRTRREAVTCLFWTKVVSLLRAADSTMNAETDEFHLVHAALMCSACPPAVARMVCDLFPDELVVRDETKGRLPLHYAACRRWHQEDWRRESAREQAAVQLLRGESLKLLEVAMDLSPPQAARVSDKEGRLVLHHVIETFVEACSRSGQPYIVDVHQPAVTGMINIIHRLLQVYPEALERRDAKTMLYPFLQATAAASEFRSPPSPNGFSVPFPEEIPLSIVYTLLRENPSLVASGHA